MMKKRLTLWSMFILFILFILLVTLSVAVGLNILANHLGYERNSPHLFLSIPFFCVILGTLLSGIASKKFMKPIAELRDATKKVAAGDFTVQVGGCPIGELNTLIQDFNKMVKDLGSIETLKNDFVTSVSHEIKTPIASIEGCLELLRDPSLTADERNEYTALIAMSTKRLSVISTNILRLSKLENEEILPDQKAFSLDEQIRQAILLLEPQWQAKNIHFNIHLQPVRILGNRDLFMQTWTNLIDNAIKFSHANGTVTIDLFHTEDRVYGKISDRGVGMDEQTLKNCFQKFYQGDQARSDQGNGLGLALVKRIIDLCQGEIAVESQPGRGATFSIILPYNNNF